MASIALFLGLGYIVILSYCHIAILLYCYIAILLYIVILLYCYIVLLNVSNYLKAWFRLKNRPPNKRYAGRVFAKT